jgi:hypothetical protein
LLAGILYARAQVVSLVFPWLFQFTGPIPVRSIVPLFAALSLIHFSTFGLQGEIIHFEDKSLASNSFFNGGPTTNSNGWTSGGAFFHNSYDSAFGGFWSGWSYSNVQNNTTPGFGNQYASYAGGGFGGAGNYAVAYQGGSNFINFPTLSSLQSTRISNTTYTAFSILNGDAFSKKFGGTTGNDPDFFLLTIRGYDSLSATGNVTGERQLYLADYRNPNNSLDYVLTGWELLDLTGLGSVRSIGFDLNSSDVGQFGINTPTYFALDQLSFNAVPEPVSLVLVALGGAAMFAPRVRKLRHKLEHCASSKFTFGVAKIVKIFGESATSDKS